MSLWQSFRGLAPRTRVFIGVGVMAYASVGLFLSDTAEQKLGYVPTDQDRAELKKIIPQIHTVDKD